MNRLSKVELARTFLAIFIALVITFILIFFISENPVEAIMEFIMGPLQTRRRIGNIIEETIPLMFSGIATIFLFRTGLFNLSAEGSIFLGGVVATVVTLSLNTGPIINMILSMLAAAIVGALVTVIPGFLKVKFNASELVTSLMLNFVALNLGLFIIQGQFRDPAINTMYSYKFPENVNLGTLVSGTRIHYGLIIAVIVILLSYYFLNKTPLGFKSRLVGSNPKMATYSGVNSFKIILLTQIIGGFISGLGSSVQLFGMYERFQFTDLTGYGWDGILIAVVAKQNPLLVPFSALFLAYIRVGASVMSRVTDVPFEIIQIIQAIIIIFVSAEILLEKYRKSVLKKEADRLEQIKEVDLIG